MGGVAASLILMYLQLRDVCHPLPSALSLSNLLLLTVANELGPGGLHVCPGTAEGTEIMDVLAKHLG